MTRLKRRQRRLLPSERDERVRAAEGDAYSYYGLSPRERVLPLHLPGGRVDVRVQVFGETSDRTPILVLHGIASISVLAAPLLPFLGDRQVFVVDWPGHGLSGPGILPPTMPFRRYAVETVRALLDELGLDVVDLVGHSLGAQISLYSALDLSTRVRRVVLLGAPGASIPGTKPLAVMKLLAVPRLGETLLSLPMSMRAFERNNDMALGEAAMADLPEPLIEAAWLLSGRTANAASIASFFRGLIKGGSLRAGVPLSFDELGWLTQPVLFAWGDEDVFLKPLDGARSIASVRDVRLLRLPGAGHAPWLQAPEAVGTAIAQHLGIASTYGPTITISNRPVPTLTPRP